MILKCSQAAQSQRTRELWVGVDGGLIWRNTIPVVFYNNNSSRSSSKSNNNNNGIPFTELIIKCTYKAARIK